MYKLLVKRVASKLGYTPTIQELVSMWRSGTLHMSDAEENALIRELENQK